MHKDERAALEPYLVADAAARAYADMRERYALHAARARCASSSTRTAQHFSVRTTGLPNVGVQGVCFGSVVTGAVAARRPFNWGQITWHELAHVFHLQLSKNHVPRWFTEGLAEYETMIARPEWKREEDYDLWVALRARPRAQAARDEQGVHAGALRRDDLMTAYYAASQAVVYIVRALRLRQDASDAGAPGARASARPSLRFERSRRGHRPRSTPTSAPTPGNACTSTTRNSTSTSRATTISPRCRRKAARAPDDADAQAALALGLLARGPLRRGRASRTARDRARAAAHARALRPDPRRARAGGRPRAERCLRAILKAGQDGYVLRVLLARAALARGRPGGGARASRARDRARPRQLEAFRMLLELADKQSDGRSACARSERSPISTSTTASCTWRYDRAAKPRRTPSWCKPASAALYIDPGQSRVHRLLGEGYLETGTPTAALVELDRALSLGHTQLGPVQLPRARACSRWASATRRPHARGRRPQARADASAQAAGSTPSCCPSPSRPGAARRLRLRALGRLRRFAGAC